MKNSEKIKRAMNIFGKHIVKVKVISDDDVEINGQFVLKARETEHVAKTIAGKRKYKCIRWDVIGIEHYDPIDDYDISCSHEKLIVGDLFLLDACLKIWELITFNEVAETFESINIEEWEEEQCINERAEGI